MGTDCLNENAKLRQQNKTDKDNNLLKYTGGESQCKNIGNRNGYIEQYKCTDNPATPLTNGISGTSIEREDTCSTFIMEDSPGDIEREDVARENVPRSNASVLGISQEFPRDMLLKARTVIRAAISRQPRNVHGDDTEGTQRIISAGLVETQIV